MRYIDMHVHSSASDGSMTPTELVVHAKENSISAIALADHDTVDGLKEAMAAGREYGVEVIPAIEISADWEGEMHILGYFIDPSNPTLYKFSTELKEFRAVRNKKMVEKLRALGYDITYEEALAEAKGANVGRVHLANILVKKGYLRSVKDCFIQLLGAGKPAYYAKQKFPPGEVISIIRSAGGSAVLAHPYYLKLEFEALDKLLGELKSLGLYGIEVLYPDHDEKYRAQLEVLAAKHSLKITGGSDFHGANKPDIKIGRVCNGEYIHYDILERFRDCRWQT